MQWSPDEHGEMKPLLGFTVQAMAAKCGGVEPLMWSAHACLARKAPKLFTEQMCDPQHFDKFQAAITAFREEFGVTPSTRVLGQIMHKTMAGCSSVSGASLAEGRPATSQQHTDAELPPVPAAGDRQITWYATAVSSSKKSRCRCRGNCVSGCPARSNRAGADCPNLAVVNVGSENMRHRPLCAACKCRVPGCLAGARRPYGKHCLPESYGNCSKHWAAPPPAKKRPAAAEVI